MPRNTTHRTILNCDVTERPQYATSDKRADFQPIEICHVALLAVCQRVLQIVSMQKKYVFLPEPNAFELWCFTEAKYAFVLLVETKRHNGFALNKNNRVCSVNSLAGFSAVTFLLWNSFCVRFSMRKCCFEKSVCLKRGKRMAGPHKATIKFCLSFICSFF